MPSSGHTFTGVSCCLFTQKHHFQNGDFHCSPSLLWHHKWHCNISGSYIIGNSVAQSLTESPESSKEGSLSGKKAPSETGVVGEARLGRPQRSWFGSQYNKWGATDEHWEESQGWICTPKSSTQLLLCSWARPSGLWGFSSSCMIWLRKKACYHFWKGLWESK